MPKTKSIDYCILLTKQTGSVFCFCFSPELLRAAVLLVPFGIESIQSLEEDQLRLRLRRARGREGRWFLQVTMFNLGGKFKKKDIKERVVIYFLTGVVFFAFTLKCEQ